ncbi:MAG: CDP-alcohol phosphatidyltransferase family protein [Thermoplasmatota archaeon]
MVLEQLRGRSTDPFFDPMTRAMRRLGLTPNGLTLLSLVFAVAGAVVVLLTPRASPSMLILFGAFAAIAAILDGLDGRLARLTNASSRRGDYLDHVVDRYSDLVLVVGIALSAWGDVRLGLAALAGVFLTSYMGTQAQALGLGRDYAGFLGRADRLVLTITAAVLDAAFATFAWPLPFGWTFLRILLLYFAVVGNITALQRFASSWKHLA